MPNARIVIETILRHGAGVLLVVYRTRRNINPVFERTGRGILILVRPVIFLSFETHRPTLQASPYAITQVYTMSGYMSSGYPAVNTECQMNSTERQIKFSDLWYT